MIDQNASLSDMERDWFDKMYEAVYMAAEAPVDAESRKHGVIGAGELREQLRLARLDRF